VAGTAPGHKWPHPNDVPPVTASRSTRPGLPDVPEVFIGVVYLPIKAYDDHEAQKH
jgi:hypothetical protein